MQYSLLFIGDNEVAHPLHVYTQMSPLLNDEGGNKRGKHRGRPKVSYIDRLAGSEHYYACDQAIFSDLLKINEIPRNQLCVFNP